MSSGMVADTSNEPMPTRARLHASDVWSVAPGYLLQAEAWERPPTERVHEIAPCVLLRAPATIPATVTGSAAVSGFFVFLALHPHLGQKLLGNSVAYILQEFKG